MLRNSESELNHDNPTSTKIRQHYLPKFKEILGSNDNAWDSCDRVDVLEILKDITHADERCEILWEAWKNVLRALKARTNTLI